jgi:hypothetical protein
MYIQTRPEESNVDWQPYQKFTLDELNGLRKFGLDTHRSLRGFECLADGCSNYFHSEDVLLRHEALTHPELIPPVRKEL